MAITKVTSGLISADASSIDLNIDAGTLYLDVSENRVGIGTTSPAGKLDVSVASNQRVRFDDFGGTSRISSRNDSATILPLSIEAVDLIINSGSGGNVGIGTDSPNAPLTVSSSSTKTVKVQNTTSSGTSIFVQNSTTGTGDTDGTYFGLDGSENAYLWNYESTNMVFGTSSTERMRIDSSGNVGINTSSPTQMLTLSNGTFQINGSSSFSSNVEIGRVGGDNNMGFATGGSERMRIDTSGNVLVGTTSPINSNYFSVLETDNNNVSVIWNSNAGFTGYVQQLLATRNTTNSSYEFLRCSINGIADKLKIYDSGNVQNTNNSYGSLSDLKLKENIVDTTPKLEKIKQVQVRNYTLKETGDKHIGVIAQELETVFPNLVEEYTDRDENGNDLGTTSKGVKYSVFVPILIKTIQEQQTIIDNLTTRIETLENA